MISVLDVARPQRTDPIVNRIREAMKTRLAPSRRAAQPLTGITAASDSM